MSPLILLPAVDVADRQAVRLVQGAAGSETTYGDPLDAALAWQSAGAQWVHLVDLDAGGCARYVITDVLKDGMLRGPNLDLYRSVCSRTRAPVVASGGVSSLDDLRALAGLTEIGVEGAIVGKALYAGAFTLEEALAEVAS